MTTPTNPSSLEVLVRTHYANGKQTVRGICGNGAYSRELPVTGRTDAIRQANLSKISTQLKKGCAAQPQFRIAFENLQEASITITQQPCDKPTLTTMKWTCVPENPALPSVLKWSEETAPGAPLPTPAELVKKAERMGDICGFRAQHVSAPAR